MNLKKILFGVLFLLSVCILHAQSNYFMQVPKSPGFEAYKRILTNNGFEFQIGDGGMYSFTKTEMGITTDVLILCPPTGIMSDIMYEYSEEGVKTSRLYKNIYQAAIDNFGKPSIKTSKAMGWFFSDYAIVVMKDKDGVSMVWTNENKKK